MKDEGAHCHGFEHAPLEHSAHERVCDSDFTCGLRADGAGSSKKAPDVGARATAPEILIYSEKDCKLYRDFKNERIK
jgi:hypothetical protein